MEELKGKFIEFSEYAHSQDVGDGEALVSIFTHISEDEDKVNYSAVAQGTARDIAQAIHFFLDENEKIKEVFLMLGMINELGNFKN